MRKSPFTLETKIIVLVWGVVAIALIVTNFLITTIVTGNIENNIASQSAGIARMVALSPSVIDGLNGTGPESEIQDVTLKSSEATGAQFVVVFDMEGVRKSHPDLEKIGQHIVGGDEQRALEGDEYISKSEGTLGESSRAFCPVYDHSGRQIGGVVVGVLLTSVDRAEQQSRFVIYGAIALGLLVGGVGAVMLARSVKRTLFGLEPFAIAQMVEERNAMFQSVREGIIAVDKSLNITLVNDEAIRLFSLSGMESDPVGRPVEEYIPDIRLEEALTSECIEFDHDQYINGVNVLVNRLPVKVNGEIVGVIATFRDMTEIRRLAEELTGVSDYVEALRSQAHEFMNKMHVVLGMVSMQCYDELTAYINRIAKEQQAEVNFIGRRVKEPVLAGFLLSKVSRARELGIELSIKEDSFVPVSDEKELIHNLVTIIGNLLDNAFEATVESEIKKVNILLAYDDGELGIEIDDTGIGMAQKTQNEIFKRGFSTKKGNRGLGLALVRQSIDLLKGTMHFTSEMKKGTKFLVVLPYIAQN